MNFNVTGIFFLSALGTIFFLVAMPIIAGLLAAEKGRNVTLWAILGAIPGFNAIFMIYFVGATNLNLEKNLDKVLAQLEKE